MKADNRDRVYDITYGVSTFVVYIFIGKCIGRILNFIIQIFDSFIGNKTAVGFLTLFTVVFLVGTVTSKAAEIISYLLENFIYKKTLYKFNWFSQSRVVKYSIRTFATIFYSTIALGVVLFIGIALGRQYPNNFKNTEIYSYVNSVVSDLRKSDIQKYMSKVVVIYNGTTLKEAVKPNEEIIYTAKSIVRGSESDKQKAKDIYDWVGQNITYDMELAELVENGEVSGDSYGARYAMLNKTGICFEYATLFASMAKEIGLSVRVVTGDAFDGARYAPHAWNQVYLNEENRWINVDATNWGFIESFDNINFDETHINQTIAGEW